MTNKVLQIALNEEQDRRKFSINEIKQLHQLTVKFVSEIGNSLTNVMDKTLTALSYNIEIITKLNNYVKTTNEINEFATFPLKTNKNFELFNCAKELIKNDFYTIISDDLWQKYKVNSNTPTMLGGVDGDQKGTSFLNCLQTSLFTILQSNQAITNIQEFKEKNIYDVNVSPNIQTTELPFNFNHSYVDPQFKEWVYFYSDKYSPPQGELLFFTLGYSFGGSREDKRYVDKKFKAEDCSSAVAKWANASLFFSTSHMEELFDNQCNNSYCMEAKSVLTPVTGEINLAQVGNVYAFRKYDIKKDPLKLNRENSLSGHTGVVTKIYPEENCFEGLSYSRLMPRIEGLGFVKECIGDHPERKYMFFSINELDNNEMINFTGLHDEL